MTGFNSIPNLVRAHWPVWKGVIPALLLAFLSTALLLAIAILIKNATGEAFSYMTREPAYIAGLPPFAGLLSNVGILIWTAAAVVCFLAATVIDDQRAFLLSSGSLTLMLLLDDMFMFHDVLFPDYLGVSQNFVYAVYIVVTLAYLATYRRRLLDSEYPVFGAALACFALSVLTDVLGTTGFGYRALVEDGFKLLGIVLWTIYFWRHSAVSLRSQSAD